MPATERALTEFPPARLYLDTDFLIGCFVPTDPHFGRATRFITHVRTHDLTTIYLSQISWVEFAHHVRKERVRGALPANIQEQLQLDRWHVDAGVRANYVRMMVGLLDNLLAHFDYEEVALNKSIRLQALEYMAQYNCDGNDAIHLATAFAVGVLDLASFDRGYRRVEGLYLWNDKIYGTT